MSHTQNVRIIAEYFNIQIIFQLMLLAEFDKRLPTFRKCYFMNV